MTAPRAGAWQWAAELLAKPGPSGDTLEAVADRGHFINLKAVKAPG
jgi:hypothetical protein